MYGGLGSAIILIIFSPVVSGAATSMIKDANFALFPLSNPGIVSIPLAFFLGWLGTVLDKKREDTAKQAEMEVRSLTGVGAEKATRPLTGQPLAGTAAAGHSSEEPPYGNVSSRYGGSSVPAGAARPSGRSLMLVIFSSSVPSKR